MPRTTRLIINDETAIYHVMSRTALDGFPLGDVEKDFMLDLIRRYSSLYFVEILGFCMMGNTFTFWCECSLNTNLQMKTFRNAMRIFMVINGHWRPGRFHLCVRNYPTFLSLCVK